MELWDEWFKHYAGMGVPTNLICKDGIINKEMFRQAKPRILFVLREANDWKEGDLRTLLANGPKYQIFHTLSRWAAGLLHSFPPYDSLNDSLSPDMKSEALKRVAVINVKKATGGASAEWKQVSAFPSRDRELLLRQIREIAPDLLVACGTFFELMWLLNLPVNPLLPDKKPVVCPVTGAQVIPMRHPNRADNIESYEELHNMFNRIGE